MGIFFEKGFSENEESVDSVGGRFGSDGGRAGLAWRSDAEWRWEIIPGSTP
jgi:hypothetical protein